MNYLFGFSGRINRAKMWLFILVTLGFEIVIVIVASFGLSWTRMAMHSASWQVIEPHGGTNIGAAFGFSHPGPIESPLNWVALGIIAVLGLAWFVALFAVSTKRLHDRGKGAIWLIPFVVLPWGIHLLGLSMVLAALSVGQIFVPYMVGFGTARLIGAILGIWAFIELFCLRGTVGENRFGPDPLA